MKNLFKLIALSLTISVILLGANNLSAVGTTNASAISNEAFVDVINFLKGSNNVVTNVQPIIGASWVSINTDISGANAGGYYTNTSYLTNLGNDAFQFQIGVDGYTTNTDCGGVDWTWDIYTNSTLGDYLTNQNSAQAPGGLFSLASGDSMQITFRVLVDAGSGTGGWQEWRLYATTPDPSANTNNYTGDNSLVYGGNLGIGWGDDRFNSVVFYGTGITGGTLDDNRWAVGAAAPLITITKIVKSIAIADASAPQGVAIPGATITFEITISNVGAGIANGLVVWDNIDLSYLDDSATAASLAFNNVVGTATWTSNYSSPTVSWTNLNGFQPNDVTELTFTVVID